MIIGSINIRINNAITNGTINGWVKFKINATPIIAIINKGNLVALDSTKNLLNKIQTKKVIFKINKKIEIKENTLDSLKIISSKEDEICVSYEKSKVNIEEIVNLVKKKNVQIYDISTDDGDLEDVFLLLTKN